MENIEQEITVKPADLRARLRRAMTLTDEGKECTSCGGIGGHQTASDRLKVCEDCRGTGERPQGQPRIVTLPDGFDT